MSKSKNSRFISSRFPVKSSRIENAWAAGQLWASARQPDGSVAPMLTPEAREILRKQREAGHDVDHAKTG